MKRYKENVMFDGSRKLQQEFELIEKTYDSKKQKGNMIKCVSIWYNYLSATYNFESSFMCCSMYIINDL